MTNIRADLHQYYPMKALFEEILGKASFMKVKDYGPLKNWKALTFGVSSNGRLLIVAHTEHGDTIRIISARPVKPGERKIYEEG